VGALTSPSKSGLSGGGQRGGQGHVGEGSVRPTRCELPPLLGVTLQPLGPLGWAPSAWAEVLGVGREGAPLFRPPQQRINSHPSVARERVHACTTLPSEPRQGACKGRVGRSLQFGAGVLRPVLRQLPPGPPRGPPVPAFRLAGGSAVDSCGASPPSVHSLGYSSLRRSGAEGGTPNGRACPRMPDN